MGKLAASDFESSLDLDKIVERALKKIYTGNYNGEFPPELWQITHDKLNEAVDDEFGKEEPVLTDHLKYQNSVFSAFKSKNQTQTLLNLKAASTAKNFTEFAAAAQATVNDYNINHLRAEWNTAKKAARSAKKWQKAVKDSDLFPNIEYLPSTAIERRDAHKAYYHMVRPIGDPVWGTILPPSDWGCQCGWRTTDKGTTPVPKDAPKSEPGLDGNPGADGELISQSHPHYDQSADDAEAILKTNIATLHGIDQEDFTVFQYDKKSKGCVFSFANVQKEDEYDSNLKVAGIVSQKGSMVQLLQSRFVNGNKVSTVDSLVNNYLTEFKSTGSSKVSRLRKHIYDASQVKGKAHDELIDFIFELPDEIDLDIVREAFRRSYGAGETKHLRMVYFIINNELSEGYTIEELAGI